jgi:hypothetical protein
VRLIEEEEEIEIKRYLRWVVADNKLASMSFKRFRQKCLVALSTIFWGVC